MSELCYIFVGLNRYLDSLLKHLISFSDPYKDPEVEEWAARKIQRSFKDFKTQKSRSSLVRSEIVMTDADPSAENI